MTADTLSVGRGPAPGRGRPLFTHDTQSRDGVGDEYYVFKVDRVFYVGGLGSDKRAEVVTAEAYANAAADPLCKHAGAIVDATNGDV